MIVKGNNTAGIHNTDTFSPVERIPSKNIFIYNRYIIKAEKKRFFKTKPTGFFVEFYCFLRGLYFLGGKIRESYKVAYTIITLSCKMIHMFLLLIL